LGQASLHLYHACIHLCVFLGQTRTFALERLRKRGREGGRDGRREVEMCPSRNKVSQRPSSPYFPSSLPPSLPPSLPLFVQILGTPPPSAPATPSPSLPTRPRSCRACSNACVCVKVRRWCG
jgi:hypothetical protein